MLRSIAYLVGGLLAGWLLTIWLAPAPAPLEPATGPPAAVEGPRGSMDRRVAALEAELERERARRLELAAAVTSLEATVASLADERPAEDAADAGPGTGDVGEAGPRPPGPPAERLAALRERRNMDRDERRVARLVDAGFAPDRAEWITQREAELRMSALEAEYEARRTGAAPSAVPDPRTVLRDDLGEADYERYLEATGQPTSVGVREVLAGSPAEQAGLEPGDRLVDYGGRRIYDLRDLNDLTVEGVPGEPVTVDVLRDGQRIQLVIPRGPLGITSGGRFGRRGP